MTDSNTQQIPNTPLNPLTTAQTLQIPAFLLPLSPSLAALHHARVKLHLGPTPGTGAVLRELEKRMKREAKGWCVHCGALRGVRAVSAPLSGADAEGSVGSPCSVDLDGVGVGGGGGDGGGPGPSTASSRARTGRGRGRGRGVKRKRGGAASSRTGGRDGGSMENVEEEALPTGEGTEISASSSTISIRLTSAPPLTPKSIRRENDCDTCGTPYARPSPFKTGGPGRKAVPRPPLPMARQLRRRRIPDQDEKMIEPDVAVPVASADSGPAAVTASAAGGQLEDVFGTKPAGGTVEAVKKEAVKERAKQDSPSETRETSSASLSFDQKSNTTASNQAPERAQPQPHSLSNTVPPPSQHHHQQQQQSIHLNPTSPKPITAKSAPSLRYIPSTSPHLPTYPEPQSQPPVRPEPAPRPLNSTGPGITTSTTGSNGGLGSGSGSGSGTARKKTKKSGLAKLLAQSKEREQAGSAGNWGFG